MGSQVTRRCLLGLLGAAFSLRSAIKGIYTVDVVLMSHYRVLGWSKTTADFLHDTNKHEFYTRRPLTLVGRENVVANQFRISFPNNPNHIDGEIDPPITISSGKPFEVQVSLQYFTPEESQQFASMFEKTLPENDDVKSVPAKSQDELKVRGPEAQETIPEPKSADEPKPQSNQKQIFYGVFRNGRLVGQRVYAKREMAEDYVAGIDPKYRSEYYVDEVNVVE